MKNIALLATLLISIAIVSANYPCGPNSCNFGEVCHTKDNICNCLPYYNCDVSLSFKKIGTWTQNGSTYTQFDVTIHNHLNRNAKQIFIGTDSSLKLRDNSSIWNVVKIANGDLTLPSYQDVNANADYTFGFIIEGTQQPNLFIKAVTF